LAKKVWQADEVGLNPLVEEYTVGTDFVTDLELLEFDIEASKAHAKMLYAKNVLTKDELNNLTDALNELAGLVKNGHFTIDKSQEDGHTAIEQYLTEKCGESGKKIHTGRSRNDQSLVMIRLYSKKTLQEIEVELKKLVKTYEKSINTNGKIVMPGYTHMQKAMPTTVGTWLGAYKDGFSDVANYLPAAFGYIDQNPLGSASGFGISNFANDRALTTKELGFGKTQDNPIYCGISRGLFENVVLQALSPAMVLAGKFANDMLLFTTSEFGFVSLPSQYTTGSSIMPQKRNYDVFEIMRGNSKLYHTLQLQIQDIVLGFGSGYQRDLQLTKKSFVDAISLCKQTIILLSELAANLQFNKVRLESAMTDDLFVTNKVYDLVNDGMSFRDAYKTIKKQFFDEIDK
jgi:argininosuccinate lyase